MVGSKGIIVELGGHEVRGVLFSSLLGRTKVERKESAPIEEGKIPSSIGRLLSAFPSDAAITLVLPGYLFLARTVTLPFTDAKIIRKTLPFELEGMVPVPVDEILVDSIPLGSTDKGRSVMALGVPKKILADCLKLFPEGRMPKRVIPDFLALLSFGANITQEKGIYGILDIETDSFSIVLISGGRPLLMRSMKREDSREAIADWVRATVTPLRNDVTEVESLYVTGAGARDAAPLLGGIARVVPLPGSVNGVSGAQWPVWATLAGAAISEAEFPRFNILGADSENEKRARAWRTLSIGTAVLLLLGTADLYLRQATASQRLSALRAESRRIFLSVMPDVKRVVKEDAQVKVALAKEMETREALMGRSSPSYLALVKGIEKTAAEHPELKIREVTVEGDRLTIAGDGSGIGPEGLKKILPGIGGVRAAQVEEIDQGAEPGSYRFRVKAQVK